MERGSRMERYKTGMLARSLAGHDAGKIYVIIGSDSAYVYLADGRLRTVDHPKRKKKKHVQPVCWRTGTRCWPISVESCV